MNQTNENNNPVGETEQWERVAAAERSTDERNQRRAEIARRDARLFGTDPSWFSF